MPQPSGRGPEDTRPPIASPTMRRRVARRYMGSALTVAGMALLLLSLGVSWLATDPYAATRAIIYTPLTLLLSLPIWPVVYLLAQLGVTLLGIVLLRSVWRDGSPSLASVAWIWVSCAVGISVALLLTYVPRFALDFDFAISRTTFGPGFFAALGGYAAALLGSLLLARA